MRQGEKSFTKRNSLIPITLSFQDNFEFRREPLDRFYHSIQPLAIHWPPTQDIERIYHTQHLLSCKSVLAPFSDGLLTLSRVLQRIIPMATYENHHSHTGPWDVTSALITVLRMLDSYSIPYPYEMRVVANTALEAKTHPSDEEKWAPCQYCRTSSTTITNQNSTRACQNTNGARFKCQRLITGVENGNTIESGKDTFKDHAICSSVQCRQRFPLTVPTVSGKKLTSACTFCDKRWCGISMVCNDPTMALYGINDKLTFINTKWLSDNATLPPKADEMAHMMKKEHGSNGLHYILKEIITRLKRSVDNALASQNGKGN